MEPKPVVSPVPCVAALRLTNRNSYCRISFARPNFIQFKMNNSPLLSVNFGFLKVIFCFYIYVKNCDIGGNTKRKKECLPIFIRIPLTSIRDGQVFEGAQLQHHTGMEETVHTLRKVMLLYRLYRGNGVDCHLYRII